MGAGVLTLLITRFTVTPTHPWIDPTAAGLVAAAVAFTVVLLVRRERALSS